MDIAIRALSPAVNDPTTTVQVLKRIHKLLSLGPLARAQALEADRQGLGPSGAHAVAPSRS